MKLKLVIIAIVILGLVFTLVSIIRPSNSLDNLQNTMQGRHNIIIGDVPISEEKISIPPSFDEHWQSIEEAVGETNYSLARYKGKTLKKYTYFVLDSPYQRAQFITNTNVHLQVLVEGEKVVAAYLIQEHQPDTPYPLNHQ